MRLIDAPVGLFKYGDCLALKTEYSTTHGELYTPDCYIVSSGEYFWGGTKTVEERNSLEVTPICDSYEPKERHGRWVDRYGGKYANSLYECSECKGKALYKFEVDVLDHEQIVQALTDICPHCGAKMDEED